MGSPILPSTIHRIIAHIFPLVEPLPPNLISKPLLQRHHFLGLTPDNAIEYLAWPSANQSHVLQLLETQTLPYPDDHLSVQYTADREDLLAHVCITPNLRLLFLWEPENGWRYHDLAIMPFLPNSYADFSTAYSVYTQNNFLPEQIDDLKVSCDNDEVAYWNAYDQGDDLVHHPPVPKFLEDSEDAYWAQYSSIQGSADSTVPSPLPVRTYQLETTSDSQPERIIVPPTNFQIHHVDLYNPLEPPTPAALSRRLEALSKEPESLSSPLVEESESDSDTTSAHLLDFNVPSPKISSDPLQLPGDETIFHNSTANPKDPVQEILQNTIRNLYILWKSGRRDQAVDQDKELFMSTVQHALEGI